MIVKAMPRGHSFKGVTAYLMNDTPDMEDGQTRVEWSALSENLAGLEIETAARVMAMIDVTRDDIKRETGQAVTGAKATAGAVYHYSLAWAKDEAPDHTHMEAAARESLDALGLSDHQFYMVGHADREHSHAHIVVNLTHQETGKRAEIGRDYVKLSEWAREYERENGIKCEARETNAEKRENGQPTKNRDQKQDYAAEVTAAYMAADNGRAFVHALAGQGLTLGTARRGAGFVIVDDKGDIQKLSRQLELQEKGRAKTAAINAKLSDLDRSNLPNGDELAAHIRDEIEYAEQASGDVDQFLKMMDAAEAHGEKVSAAAATKEIGEIEKKDLADGKKRATEKLEKEMRDKTFTVRIEAVKLRQMAERKDLETRLEKYVAPKLVEVTDDAARMKNIVEGQGVKFGLRRIWRGKKDRAIFEQLQTEKFNITQDMREARKRLSVVHRDEVAKLRQIHAQKKERFADYTIEQKINILNRVKSGEFDRSRKRKPLARPMVNTPRSPQGSVQHGQQERARRIDRQIWNLKEGERRQAQESATMREMAALRPAAEARAAEIHRQTQTGTEAGENEHKSGLQRQIDKIRQDIKSKSKDRGFEP